MLVSAEDDCETFECGGKRKLVLKKKKRKRTVITREESDILERAFQKNAIPDRFMKLELARDIEKTITFVSVWFQNRRARERKMNPVFGKPRQTQIEEPTDFKKADPNPLANETMPPVLKSPFFHRIVRMAGAAEGSILSRDSPFLSEAFTDSCRGIELANGHIFYHLP